MKPQHSVVGLFLILLLCTTPQSAYETRVQTDAHLTVDARQVRGHISELLYGQFIEFMYEGVKSGLTAELIRDRGFEDAPNAIGLPRYWERYPDDRNDDYALSFAQDEMIAYSAPNTPGNKPLGHSLKIDVKHGVIWRHGVYQSRIPVRSDLNYRSYVWLKTSGYQGKVTMAREADVSGGEVYAESHVEGISGDWRQYEFTLKPRRSDALARLAILFDGEGRIWLDQASLVPGDSIDGVRSDVLERVKALRPAFVRWPGGNVAQDYHWMWGIGQRDRRPTWVNLAWKNEIESGDFGTDEFVSFCRNIGAEPSITVNVEGGGASAEEAAAWVEYCNGPVTSKYGAMRAANGHPAPYGVKYWEIGNEIWGDWVRGHSDAPTYARNLIRYATAMRAVDPQIKLIGVGDNNLDWDRTVLKTAGQMIDFLSIHHYYGRREMQDNLLNLMARPLHYEAFYRDLDRMIRELQPGREVKLAINEWGLDLTEAQQYSMAAALYAARLMNVFERSAGIVGMSAVSDLINGWPGGIIQSSRHAVFVTPIYLVNQLYATHYGSTLLTTAVECPTFDSRDARQVPVLDAVASRSPDGKRVFIKAVNMDLTKALRTRVDFLGAEIEAISYVETLAGTSLTDTNSFARPDSLTTKSSQVNAGRSLVIDLPKHSVSVITLQISR
jgi:alpha-L-arabinofuranosidase